MLKSLLVMICFKNLNQLNWVWIFFRFFFTPTHILYVSFFMLTMKKKKRRWESSAAFSSPSLRWYDDVHLMLSWDLQQRTSYSYWTSIHPLPSSILFHICKHNILFSRPEQTFPLHLQNLLLLYIEKYCLYVAIEGVHRSRSKKDFCCLLDRKREKIERKR